MSGNLAHSPRFSSAAALMRHYAAVRQRVNSWAPPPLVALPSPEMMARGNPAVLPFVTERPKPRRIVTGEMNVVPDIIPNQRGTEAAKIFRLSADVERTAIRRAAAIYLAAVRNSPSTRRLHLVRQATAEAFRIDAIAIPDISKRAGVTRIRQAGMCLAHRLVGGQSLPNIARAFGRNDHTTALHSIRKLGPLIDEILGEMHISGSCGLEALAIVEGSQEDGKPTVRRRLRAHIRLGSGSSYAYDLLDEAGGKIGEYHAFVARSKKEKSSHSYFLGEREFATAAEFLEAYYAKLEQDRRDAEWNAAAPASPEGAADG
jgi:hypothetical protein